MMTIYDKDQHLKFIAFAKDVKEFHIVYEVFEVECLSVDREPLYLSPDTSDLTLTPHPDNRFLIMDVKWDGCMNMHFDGYIHLCEGDGFDQLHHCLHACRNHAARNIKSWCGN